MIRKHFLPNELVTIDDVVLKHMTCIKANDLAKLCSKKNPTVSAHHAQAIASAFQSFKDETGLDITDEKNELFYLGTPESTINIYFKDMQLAVKVELEPYGPNELIAQGLSAFLDTINAIKPFGGIGIYVVYFLPEGQSPWDAQADVRMLGVYGSEITIALNIADVATFLNQAKN